MQSRFYISALAAATLLQGGIASAQTINSPGTAGTVITPNGNSAVGSTTTGAGLGTSAGGASRSSAPTAPVPKAGPGPSTSLPGDNPAAPGFPGKVGR